MARLRQKQTGATKKVLCTHCGAELVVAVRAMSMFCPHCHKRVILEDFTIRTYHAVREFATCGDVLVEKSGTIAADVKAGRLTVEGKVWGKVEARRKVEIASTGYVKGAIRAPALTVADGASLACYCEIRPDANGAPQRDASRRGSPGSPPRSEPSGDKPTEPRPKPRNR